MNKWDYLGLAVVKIGIHNKPPCKSKEDLGNRYGWFSTHDFDTVTGRGTLHPGKHIDSLQQGNDEMGTVMALTGSGKGFSSAALKGTLGREVAGQTIELTPTPGADTSSWGQHLDDYFQSEIPASVVYTFKWKECKCGFLGFGYRWSTEKEYEIPAFFTKFDLPNNRKIQGQYAIGSQGATYKDVFPSAGTLDMDLKGNISRQDIVQGLRKAKRKFKKVLRKL